MRADGIELNFGVRMGCASAAWVGVDNSAGDGKDRQLGDGSGKIPYYKLTPKYTD